MLGSIHPTTAGATAVCLLPARDEQMGRELGVMVMVKGPWYPFATQPSAGQTLPGPGGLQCGVVIGNTEREGLDTLKGRGIRQGQKPRDGSHL